MITRKFNAVTVTGSYEDKEGNKKNNYLNVGAVLENEQGHLDLKLDAYPVPNAKGEVWIKLFPVKEEPKKSDE